MSSLKNHIQTRQLSDLNPVIESIHFYTIKQRQMVERMVRKHRQLSPILIDPQNNILSGYLIYWAMKKLGLKKAMVIELS